MIAIVLLRALLAARACVRTEPEMKARSIMQRTRFGTKGVGMTRSGQVHIFRYSSHVFASCCLQPDAPNPKNPTERSTPAGCRGLPAPRKSSPAPPARSSRRPVRCAQAADAVDKALATDGWQKYVAPHTSLLASDSQRSLSLKKGPWALGVFITVAPAQGNATSVQYNAVPLKNDVPFPKDASNIEFDPNKPLLTLLSAEPIDKTLEFYRKELAPLGWSLWSQKLNGVQPAGGASGELTRSGAYAYYLQGDRRLAALVLESAEAGPHQGQIRRIAVGISGDLAEAIFQQRQYRRRAG